MSVTVNGLTVVANPGRAVLDRARLELSPGRITALTGPSGSGKTTLLRAVLGDLAPGLSKMEGSIEVLGRDVFALPPAHLQRFRRAHLAYVSQDPGAALNPTMRVSALLAEAAGTANREPLCDTLDRVRLTPGYLRRRPAELSGGEQRRVALARALIRGIDVLLVDEPMAGLDTKLRNEIAALLRQLADEDGIAVAVSGHANALYELADDATELSGTNLPPPAPMANSRPRSTERERSVEATKSAAPLLRGRRLGAGVRSGRRTLLRDIDVAAYKGCTTAIIGASGAGKTTLARVLVGLHRQCSGLIHLEDDCLHPMAHRRTREQRRRIQLIPQDPLSTLNPRHTVGAAVARPLALHRRASKAERAGRVGDLLGEVGLPTDFAERYPHELSGGQRQRVAIARALAADPEILICDEITSALDAGTAATIMELLERTQATRELSLIIISHDLRLVRRHCATVLVLHHGEVVETGPTARVFTEPDHPATIGLLDEQATVDTTTSASVGTLAT